MITINDLYNEVREITEDFYKNKVIDSMDITINNTNLPIFLGRSITIKGKVYFSILDPHNVISGNIILTDYKICIDSSNAIGCTYNIALEESKSDNYLGKLDILKIPMLSNLYEKVSYAYDKINGILHFDDNLEIKNEALLKILGHFIAMSIFKNSGSQLIHLHTCEYILSHSKKLGIEYYIPTHAKRDDAIINILLEDLLPCENSNNLARAIISYIVNYGLLSFIMEYEFDLDFDGIRDDVINEINKAISDEYCLNLIMINNQLSYNSIDLPFKKSDLIFEKDYLTKGYISYSIDTGVIKLIVSDKSHSICLATDIISLLSGNISNTQVMKNCILDESIPSVMKDIRKKINTNGYDKDLEIRNYVDKICSVLKYINSNDNLGLGRNTDYAMLYSEISDDDHICSKVCQMFYNELL